MTEEKKKRKSIFVDENDVKEYFAKLQCLISRYPE
jgi:hypothetical protein